MQDVVRSRTDRTAAARPWAPVALLLSLLLCYAAAGIGSSATAPAIAGWYTTLAKPGFTPPNWVFAPVWTLLYGVMAIVLWQIWRTRSPDRAAARRTALVAFAVQLVLNVTWSLVFFGLKAPWAGVGVIAALFSAIVWSLATARVVIGGWAVLHVPYLCWVAFAAVLNVAIARLNG